MIGSELGRMVELVVQNVHFVVFQRMRVPKLGRFAGLVIVKVVLNDFDLDLLSVISEGFCALLQAQRTELASLFFLSRTRWVPSLYSAKIGVARPSSPTAARSSNSSLV